jgi:prepilin signal peptidase PulO-like enzyme (type II secretory pathway)
MLDFLAAVIAFPMPVRVLIVVAVAVFVARLINRAIYRWAYSKSDFGPWAKPPKGQPSHTLLDHLPAIGWWRLRRESKALKNSIFWIRPLILEIVFPVAIAWYYHFYVSGGALSTRAAALAIQPELHCQFLGHFVLIALMTVATFIDFDEFTIPDMVTVPGTIIGLLGSLLFAAWLPYNALITPMGVVFGHQELQAVTPALPPWMSGPWGLGIALAIIAGWGFALLDRRWIARRGIGKAIQYLFARMFANRGIWLPVLITCLFLTTVTVVAWQSSAERWPMLLSSLLGLAFAGGVTWAVRLAASWALRVEALGFGDVTLMAMIGSYIGWQASLIVFFMAPMVAFVIVLIRAIITGQTATPYGPYLCTAAAILLAYWNPIWNGWASPLFELGNMILGVVAACIAMLGAILWIWRLIKEALGIKTF